MSDSDTITAKGSERPGGLCGNYVSNPGAYDEMFESGGALRSHWFMFINQINELGAGEIQRRWNQARQLIHDNGVTYNVYGDPKGMDRPWQLDPIPLLLDSTQWSFLERGLIQRACLLDRIIADCYGPQRLIQEGLLPPELILTHPYFLRPCHGARLPNNRWLYQHAVDLARSPNGTFFVMSDRTQTPAGVGYALENRIVLSRALPDIFRDCNVRRLAQFFLTFRETLINAAPRNKDNPRVVVLTPGPYSETYFEHSYLARYLGYTLVEGGDLTVRDSQVYLKTLAGLEPVDVILRRLDDDFCDPLELRADSFLGVAGLVQAVHAGTVSVINALGTGLAQTPALAPFLPTLCRRLLDQDMLLRSAASWWCGDPASLSYVLDHPEDLVIKQTFPRRGVNPVFMQNLSTAQRADMLAEIRRNPQLFVAQEQLTLATTPVLTENGFEPRHMQMRVHLVASRADSYAVMPGGLTRFSASSETLVVSMQEGGGSKDTWVIADGPVDNLSLLPPTGQNVTINRGGNDLSSRSADNLFWLGRYMERAEGLTRLMRGILLRAASQAVGRTSSEIPILLSVAIGQSHAAAGTPVAPLGVSSQRGPLTPATIESILYDANQPGSLYPTLTATQRLGGVLRDRLSIDTWRVISSLDQPRPGATQGDSAWQLNDILADLDQLIVHFAAFGGFASESMTHGHAWRFLDMGRRLERALHTMLLLRGTMDRVCDDENLILEAILEIADSSMTYRRRYLTNLQAAAVLDLLLLDEGNPRSVGFQLARLTEHIASLPRSVDRPHATPEQKIILRALTGVRLADVQAACKPQADGRRDQLDELVKGIIEHLEALSDAISRGYLSHTNVSYQLGSLPAVNNL